MERIKDNIMILGVWVAVLAILVMMISGSIGAQNEEIKLLKERVEKIEKK